MSKWPVHQNPRPDRAAKAPYNFVPLPERVVTVDPNSLPDQDRYYPDLHTGWIDCRLITASLLYVRAALEPEEFERSLDEEVEKERPWHEQVRNKPDFFYTGEQRRPVIPGSSLRGMLRALVEIVGYGKMQWVTDQQRYFFRAVAAPRSDPLARPYKEALGKVQAGYVVARQDKWYILPAKQIQGESFLKVKEEFIPSTVLRHRFDSPDYQPTYIPVSFTYKQTPRGRWVIDKVGKPDEYPDRGTMVCSGNMLETVSRTERFRHSPRRNHCVVPEKDTAEKLIPIDEDAIRDYRSGLTDFQKSKPFHPQMGCLIEGNPVFYLLDSDGVIRAFGHTLNFRVPFRREGARCASSPWDYVPEALRRESDTDLAEAIFGYTKSQGQGKERAYAGRVFITDARLNGDPDQAWLAGGEPVVPRILGSPKPTTFQHYLVQTAPNQSASLHHYASDTPGEAIIRGHKLYWHKGAVGVDDVQEEDPKDKQDTQHTQIRPVRADVTFDFRIYFENLSSVELGVLLWVLDKARNDAYRLKLGMGKPYGMGAVKIESALHLTDPAQRYKRLFQDEKWAVGSKSKGDLVERAIEQFEQLILRDSILNPREVQSLDKVERIQALLAMLSWTGPDREQTRYLRIEHPEHGNEYKGRPVLPDPLAVSGIHVPEERPAVIHTGIVKWFSRQKGYGFIQPDEEDADVFFHFTQLAGGLTDPLEGTRVSFVMSKGPRGRDQAQDVRPEHVG